MRRAELLRRRERIEAAVRNGADPMQVAHDEKASWSLIYGICRVARIKISRPTPRKPLPPLKREFHEVAIKRAFDILAQLRTGERTLKGIGEHVGVSWQWVSQIETMALEKGLLSPRAARKRPGDS